MIGTTQLKEIIVNSKESNLDLVLEKLDSGIQHLLKQYDEESSEDGMEIAIIKYNHKKNLLEFAGANQNLYIVNESSEIIKGNSRSIGGWVRKRSRLPNFKSKTLNINNIKSIYLTTDGLEDQFGGENNTKFGRERFLNIIREPGSQSKIERIEKEFKEWKNKSEQIDDVSIIEITFNN